VFAIAVLSFLTWYATRDTLPETIRIATSSTESFYFDVGGALARYLEEASGHEVEVVETDGSIENLRLLEAGDVELAIVQASSLPLDGIGVVSPLFSEVVHVIVRRERGLAAISDLVGKRVAIGEPGSAMREDALKILDHYRVAADDIVLVEGTLDDMLSDDTIDAAFVTTGLLSPSLDTLWRERGFDLLPVSDAAALALKYAYFFEVEIPRGLYDQRPPVPAHDTKTVATTALLVVRNDATKLLVHQVLESLYDSKLRLEFTTLIKANEAREWPLVPLHPFARSYFRPYEGIDLLASFMESLAATKELLFALAAALYLVWSSYRRMKDREEAEDLQKLKDYLDTFLDETIRIEKAQMDTADPAELEAYLDEVTRIKLEALEQLSHEDLRGDRTFLIFLTQCANLIAKIQRKLETAQRS
jgi:TRAP transporter TAXI family solute receptor